MQSQKLNICAGIAAFDRTAFVLWTKETFSVRMANIYVTPLLSPSFERFPNHSASEIQNDQFPTIGDHRVEPKDKEDENANKSIPHACKTATDTREACGITSHGTNSLDCIKGGKSDAQHHLQNVTTANELGRTFVDLKYDETTGNAIQCFKH